MLFDLDSKDLFNKEIEYVVTEALKTSKQGVLAAIQRNEIKILPQRSTQKQGLKKSMFVGTKDPVLNVETLKQEAKNYQISLHLSDSGHMSHIEAHNELIMPLKFYD